MGLAGRINSQRFDLTFDFDSSQQAGRILALERQISTAIGPTPEQRVKRISKEWGSSSLRKEETLLLVRKMGAQEKIVPREWAAAYLELSCWLAEASS